MSTTNTETLKLYKNTKLYNGSRYKVYQNNKTMEQYLGTAQYSKTVYYKSINEPIVINEFIKNCDEYTYGSITNEGKTYYFFVDSIITDAYKQTTINYTIDWWSTNWNNISCTKAHLLRQPSKPQYMQQPYSPLYENGEKTTVSNDYCFGATYIPSSENGTSYISFLIMEGNTRNYNLVNNGHWYIDYGIPGADIKDSFVIPFISYDYIKQTLDINTTYIVKGETESEVKTYVRNNFDKLLFTTEYKKYILYLEDVDTYWTMRTVPRGSDTSADFTLVPYIDDTSWKRDKLYEERYVKYTTNVNGEWKYIQQIYNKYDITVEEQVVTKDMNVSFKSNEFKKQGLIDWNGNIVWECPYNIEISGFKVTLLKGLSHVMLQFTPYIDNDTSIVDLNNGKGFTYDCRHPGLFVDSYQDYVLKNRDYDIAMRRIQSEKQEFQAWASTAENIGFGYAFGGAGTGAMRGATAAGVGGVIEAVATTVMNNLFDPKIQSQYDSRYARMTDQISIIGDSITNLNIEESFIKYTLTMDNSSFNKMKNDIEINGYISNEIVNNLQGMFKDTKTVIDDFNTVFNVNPVFQADNVVVEGACNLEGKRQVVQRLMNGVEFI